MDKKFIATATIPLAEYEALKMHQTAVLERKNIRLEHYGCYTIYLVESASEIYEDYRRELDYLNNKIRELQGFIDGKLPPNDGRKKRWF